MNIVCFWNLKCVILINIKIFSFVDLCIRFIFYFYRNCLFREFNDRNIVVWIIFLRNYYVYEIFCVVLGEKLIFMGGIGWYFVVLMKEKEEIMG